MTAPPTTPPTPRAKPGATHVVQLKTHRGLASAFLAGINAALRLGADIIVNTDADNQYAGADIPKLIAPIIRGSADVVIGDREVAKSPHMSAIKRFLQRLGSRTVGLASGIRVGDVTSGFRAFSRDAAMQINVFNPFTYTLETIIQAGNRNLGVQSVPVRTNRRRARRASTAASARTSANRSPRSSASTRSTNRSRRSSPSARC